METNVKNARWAAAATTGNQMVLASQNPKAHAMFGGKTLSQVGNEYDLADEDITFGYSTIPQSGNIVRSLIVKVGGTKYVIQMSRGIADEHLENASILANCRFNLTHLSVKNDDGTPKTDENGKIVLDETKPYLSFGRPSALTIEREEAAFKEPVEIPQA